MLKEVLNAKYQNFYINEDGIICGIVTPKLIWKITEPEELLSYYKKRAERLSQMGNYTPAKEQLEQVEKLIRRLEKAIQLALK